MKYNDLIELHQSLIKSLDNALFEYKKYENQKALVKNEVNYLRSIKASIKILQKRLRRSTENIIEYLNKNVLGETNE